MSNPHNPTSPHAPTSIATDQVSADTAAARGVGAATHPDNAQRAQAADARTASLANTLPEAADQAHRTDTNPGRSDGHPREARTDTSAAREATRDVRHETRDGVRTDAALARDAAHTDAAGNRLEIRDERGQNRTDDRLERENTRSGTASARSEAKTARMDARDLSAEERSALKVQREGMRALNDTERDHLSNANRKLGANIAMTEAKVENGKVVFRRHDPTGVHPDYQPDPGAVNTNYGIRTMTDGRIQTFISNPDGTETLVSTSDIVPVGR